MKPETRGALVGTFLIIGAMWGAAALGEFVAGPTPASTGGSIEEGEAPVAPPVVDSSSPTPGLRQPRVHATTASRSRSGLILRTATPVPATSTGSLLNWTALAECESSNDPTQVSTSGKYRGAFQFDLTTWANYGPAGDPAAAPYIEQLRRAQALYADRGRSPWPYCGRFL